MSRLHWPLIVCAVWLWLGVCPAVGTACAAPPVEETDGESAVEWPAPLPLPPVGMYDTAAEPRDREPDSAESLPSAEFETGPRLISRFDEGFVVATEDDQFELRLRIMEQTDFKLFLPRDQEPARSGAYIPRFRSYFEGHLTRSFEYEMSLQRSVEGTFDVLDANINYHPDDAFQIKIGRFLVPYSYDWYDHLEQFFIAPERGLFPLNFGLSREAGTMLWGVLNEGQVQYAIGAFFGQLSGLADNNTTRDGVGYLNVRPFRGSGNDWLENVNIGGSVGVGKQVYANTPLPLRTSLQSSENDEAAQAASSVFLEFNDDVVLLGDRDQAALHLAWYVGSLSLESEAQVGRFDYATPQGTTRLSAAGYHVGFGYFVTGEQISGRTIVKPLRPFDPASGRWGPGAWEPYFRFSRLTLGPEVFSRHLADEADWTRQLSMIDLGWNWYPNRFVKFYCDWQVSLYDTPVLLNREQDLRSRQNNLLWLRAQIFF